MDKVWRNFLIAILSVLILLLAFLTVYEEVNKYNTEQQQNVDKRIDEFTLYDKDKNILYQIHTKEGEINVESDNNSLAVYVPFQQCSCFDDGE